MISFTGLRNFAKKSIKKSTSFEFVQTDTPLSKKLENKNRDDWIKINIEKYEKKKEERGLRPDEKPIPVSPTLYPITVPDPKVSSKKYQWCSCGMSLKQPFCDGSHLGTKFFPVRFTLEEEVKEINLCGCKYSTKAPFCDSVTCKKLRGINEPDSNITEPKINIVKEQTVDAK